MEIAVGRINDTPVNNVKPQTAAAPPPPQLYGPPPPTKPLDIEFESVKEETNEEEVLPEKRKFFSNKETYFLAFDNKDFSWEASDLYSAAVYLYDEDYSKYPIYHFQSMRNSDVAEKIRKEINDKLKEKEAELGKFGHATLEFSILNKEYKIIASETSKSIQEHMRNLTAIDSAEKIIFF